MDDNNKLVQSKKAAKNIINDKQLLGENTEIAIYCFVSCEPMLAGAFSQDRKFACGTIDCLYTGGRTPLAASIEKAGSYLLQYSNRRNKMLIVLSDGLETEGGNPTEAIQKIRRLSTDVRKEGW
jgi:Mg-chelatase subunit ChlD